MSNTVAMSEAMPLTLPSKLLVLTTEFYGATKTKISSCFNKVSVWNLQHFCCVSSIISTHVSSAANNILSAKTKQLQILRRNSCYQLLFPILNHNYRNNTFYFRVVNLLSQFTTKKKLSGPSLFISSYFISCSLKASNGTNFSVLSISYV